MKQNKNIKLKRLIQNGNDPAVLANYWKVIPKRLVAADYLAGKLPSGMHYNSAIVPFLLSARNRTAAFFDLNAVKIARERNNNGKDLAGLAAELRYVPVLPLSQVANGSGEVCPTSGVSVVPRIKSFAINRRTVLAPIELSMAQLRCLQEGSDQQMDYTLLNYFAAAASQFMVDVEKELFAKTNGQFRHIGNLPPKNEFVNRVAGEGVGLFLADGRTPNPLGESKIYQDFAQAGVPASQMMFFGGTRFSDYAKLKQWSVPNDQGFNASTWDAIEVGDMRNWFSATINQASGLAAPLLALRPGAVQIITANRNVGDFEHIKDTKKRTTVPDPFLGLVWDLYENVVECEDEIKTMIHVSIDWTLITYPDCDDTDQGPMRRGVNDVFLYNIICEDTNACQTEPVAFDFPSYAKNVTSDCNTTDLVCLADACTVSLSAATNNNGDLVLTAGFNGDPSTNATPSYSWTLNGAPVLGTSNVLILPQGTWDNGDEVTVTVEQGDCTATASYIVEQPCPALRVSFCDLNTNCTEIAANGTLNISDQERGLIGTLRIENASTNDAVLVVTAVSETNAVLTLGAVTLPANIAEGDYISVSLTIPAGAADGSYTAKFQVSSNDCDLAVYSSNLQFNVVTV